MFHELVHVVQYETLGLSEFAAKYFSSFLSSDLRSHTAEKKCDELDARFSANSTETFSAEAEGEGTVS